jgi:hypothetical protein
MKSLRLFTWFCVVCTPACHAQGNTPIAGADPQDSRTTAAAMGAMRGPMTDDPHMMMTPLRAPGAGDSGRAAMVLDSIRHSLNRYRDVGVALADGYRPFLPGVKQSIYHFTNRRRALAERLRFDPAEPTSLLYRPDANGAMVLVGVMYTEAPGVSLDELNRRIPLSIARWHQHVNWCVPPRGDPGRWRDSSGGRPLFGPKSPIATPAACDAVGGRFVPRVFGWMVHVNAFVDDPAGVWGGHEGREPS